MVAPGNQEMASFFLIIPELSTSLGTWEYISIFSWWLWTSFLEMQMVYGGTITFGCLFIPWKLPWLPICPNWKEPWGRSSVRLSPWDLTKVNPARETQTAGQLITYRGKERTHSAEIWSDQWRKTFNLSSTCIFKIALFC